MTDAQFVTVSLKVQADGSVDTKVEANPYYRGVIYWLRCQQDPRVYIGSTTESDPQERLTKHRESARYTKECSIIYEAMREYGPENFTLEVVEHFPCNSLKELVRREFDHIEEFPRALLYNDTVEYGKFSENHKRKIGEAVSASWTPERKREQSEMAKAWWTDERRRAFGESRKGANHPNFKGGSVNHFPNRKNYLVCWRENGARKSKSFSYGPRSKRTQEQAQAEAEAHKAGLQF